MSVDDVISIADEAFEEHGLSMAGVNCNLTIPIYQFIELNGKSSFLSIVEGTRLPRTFDGKKEYDRGEILRYSTCYAGNLISSFIRFSYYDKFDRGYFCEDQINDCFSGDGE